MTPIINWVAPSATTSVTFSSLPQNYTDLVIVTNGIANATGADIFVTHFNGDNASNTYSVTELYGSGSSAGSSRAVNQNGFVLGWLSTFNLAEWAPSVFNIMNYSNTTTYKPLLLRSGVATTSGGYVQIATGVWRNTSAVTSIIMRTVNGYQMKAGTTISIYGIKAA
jgi:hypothetical protein